MNRKRAAARMIVLLALILAMVSGSAAAENYDAGTMRLLRYEGSVEIFDPEGVSRFVLENVRFASGEAMQTGEDGMASIGLDDTKIVTLDASSRVEFIQENSQMRLKLSQGALFLDVQEKLDENESLDIETSTMTVGIRGTIVYVEEIPEDEKGKVKKARNAGTNLGILEGTAQIYYTDSSGTRRRMDVPAGRKVSIPLSTGSEGGVTPVITILTSDDIEGFVSEQILGDENTTNRVLEGSPEGQGILYPELGTGTGDLGDGFDFSAEGDWTWDETVTLVAQSASKLYDGETLRRTSDVLVYGLPQGLSIQVAAGGAQTDAGESENAIANYHIYNADREEVTSHFTNVEKVSGTLTVDPAPLTVWTGSAEKYYDGTPLTNNEVELRTVPGYEVNEPTWRNTSIITRSALGSESMIAVSGATWVHGTNPLTGETQEIVLYTGQKLSVVLRSEEGQEEESIEFVVETLSVAELPEEVLRLYANNPRLRARAIKDAKWDEEELLERIAELEKSSEKTVTRNGLRVSGTAEDDLMQDSSNVRITVDSDVTNYNSRPLNGDEAHFVPIEIDPTISIKATGSQTQPGESANTYEISWGEAKPKNYILTDDLGTLTVLPVYKTETTLTAASVEKVYDGKPLENDGFEVTDLPDGYTVEAKVEGTQTDAGEGENKITEYKILDEDGKDATKAFPNLKVVSGSLKVKPAPLTVKTGTAEKVYDGQALVSDVEMTGLVNDETAEIAATGTLTEAGTTKNTYTITWGTAKKENYEIQEEVGTLTVEALKIEVNIGGTETSYNGGAFIPNPTLTYTNGTHAGETVTGTRLRAMDVVYRFTLFTGETVDLTITGMGTGAGDYTLTGSAATSSGSSVNLDMSFTSVELHIEPAILTITTGSASKLMDGTPLTCEEVTVEGLQGGDQVTVKATGKLEAAGTAKNTYTIDWGDTNKDNYTVAENLGTLEMTAIDAAVTLTAPSVTRAYDGTKLTATEVQVEGLPEGYTCTAEITGSQLRVGTSGNVISSYQIKNPDGADVTAAFTDVTPVNGTLTVTKNETPIIITANSRSTVYNGQAQYSYGSCTVEGLPAGVSIDAEAPCSVKDAGEYTLHPSYYMTDEEGAFDHTECFSSITEKDGTLTVEPLKVTVGLGGDETVVFDGQYHGADPAVTCDNQNFTLKKVTDTQWDISWNWSDIIHFSVTGGGTDAANYTLSNSGYSCTNSETGYCSPDNFDVTFTGKSLKITPLQIKADLGGGTTSVFGNDPPLPATTLTCINGNHTGEEIVASGVIAVTGSQTENYALYTGDEFELQTSNAARNVGDYTIWHSLSFTSGNESNYTFSYENEDYHITPATVTIQTGSAEKYYDGTALKSDELTVTGLVGLPGVEYTEEQEPVVTVTGSQTDIGESDNTYSIDWRSYLSTNYTVESKPGRLTVKGYDDEVTITAGSASKVYDGTALTVGAADYTVTGLPEGFSCEATVSGSQTDAGTGASQISACTITNAAHADVTAAFSNLTIRDGKLTVSPLEITIEPEVYGGTYTGYPIVPETIHVLYSDDSEEEGDGGPVYDAEEWPVGYKAVYNLKGGGQLEVECGSFTDANTYTVTPGTSFTAGKSSNYKIINPGKKITIDKLDLEFSLGGYFDFDYDGEYHGPDLHVYCDTESHVSVQTGDTTWEVVGGRDVINVTITGGGKDAGEYPLHCSYSFTSAKESNFNISPVGETIKINRAPLTIKTESATKTFDGTPLTATTPTVTGLVGEDATKVTVTVTGTITDAGTAENSYTIDWGSVTSSNYNVKKELGTLTVKPRNLTVSTSDAEKTYDGTALTKGGATFDGLADGDAVTATVTGSITNVGSTPNSFTINWGSVKSSNYNVTEKPGTLTVNQRLLTVTSKDADKIWDGEPLTCEEYTQEGLVSGETIKVIFTGSQTDVGYSDNTFNVEFDSAKKENYDLKTKFGTLTVNEEPWVTDGGY